ncbi:MAG: phytanoyl-CoA dioxygenase family protein [Pseudomonadota bacterium]
MLQTPILDLSQEQIRGFVTQGFVRLDDAIPREVTARARRRLWRDLGGDGRRPSTWSDPVQRLSFYGQKPFRQALATPRLQRAFDQLVGAGRWEQPERLGPFVVRFPSARPPRDARWHIDGAYPPADSSGDANAGTDPTDWRVNIHSQNRALLMLILFSDVGPRDGPTRLRAGSHLDIAPVLERAGPDGVSARALDVAVSEDRLVYPATGRAGTVYLCHPFLVHEAQRNRSQRPRFLAHCDLNLAAPLVLGRVDGRYTPVEWAIRKGICWYP